MNISSKKSASPGSKTGRMIGVSPAAASTLACEAWIGSTASSVWVSTNRSSRRGTMSRPGASSPQRDSASHRLSERTSPMKVPSWCQAPGTDGAALRSVVLCIDISPGSPR